MKVTVAPRSRKIAWLMFLIYFGSYIMRINFAVMLVKIISDTGLDKTQLSLVLTVMTVTYGVGQIISGILGDRLPPVLLISCGLGLAALCNITMGLLGLFAPVLGIMCAVWGVNGFAHALMWPPMVRLMSATVPDQDYAYTATHVSWGSSVATVVLYLLCSLLLSLQVAWQAILFGCAVAGTGILIVWLIAAPRLLTPIQQPVQQTVGASSVYEKATKTTYLPLLFVMLGILLQGILRDGVTTWMPTYMTEVFHMKEEASILCTVILAVFSIFALGLFARLQQTLFHNEIFCGGFIFLLSAVAAFALFAVASAGGNMVATMLLMGAIVACMHGTNLMLTSVVPKRFLKYGSVATVSGVLNAFTYVGAAVATYGFAVLSERIGWNNTVLSWGFVSLAGMAVCAVCAPVWKKKFNL